MDISDIVSVAITADTRTSTRPGFGIACFVAYHTRTENLVDTYSDLSEMVADGFVVGEPAYLMAAAALAQNPRPSVVKIGRLPAAFSHSQEITITDATEGNHILLTLNIDGTETTIDYTILAAATTTTVATAVELLIEAVTGVTSSSASAVITAAPASGKILYVYDIQGCTVRDLTADAGYDDALTDIVLEDPDFYFVAIDVNSEANIDLVAAWAESNGRFFVAGSANTIERSAGTVFDGLEGSGYEQTLGAFQDNAREYLQCRLIGRVSPYAPGSINWKFKRLAGQTASAIDSTEQSHLDGNKANYYVSINGLDIFTPGVMMSGQYADIRHGIDWLTSEIKSDIFDFLANQNKVPYTDVGLASLMGVLNGTLLRAVNTGLLVAGSITISVPAVADQASGDRSARIVRDLKFGADLQGAVNTVHVSGTLSV